MQIERTQAVPMPRYHFGKDPGRMLVSAGAHPPTVTCSCPTSTMRRPNPTTDTTTIVVPPMTV